MTRIEVVPSNDWYILKNEYQKQKQIFMLYQCNPDEMKTYKATVISQRANYEPVKSQFNCPCLVQGLLNNKDTVLHQQVIVRCNNQIKFK